MSATAETDLPAKGLGDSRLRLAFGGLLVAKFIGALDQTIMTTALPTIAGQLGGLTDLSWVVTAHVLAAAAATPLWGKASDLYGRRGTARRVAIAIFVAFSALSGTAQSIGELIAFRRGQGVGAGGVMTLAARASPISSRRASAAATRVHPDHVPAGEPGRTAAGGLFVDQLSWRWAFYVNVPIGAARPGVLIVTCPRAAHRRAGRDRLRRRGAPRQRGRRDHADRTWGGSQYGWGSPEMLGLIAGAVGAARPFTGAGANAPPSRSCRCACSRPGVHGRSRPARSRDPVAVRGDRIPAGVPAARHRRERDRLGLLTLPLLVGERAVNDLARQIVAQRPAATRSSP